MYVLVVNAQNSMSTLIASRSMQARTGAGPPSIAGRYMTVARILKLPFVVRD